MELEGKQTVVLDLEPLARPDDCRHCGRPAHAHGDHRSGQSCKAPGNAPWRTYARRGHAPHRARHRVPKEATPC
jgi:hypothetical protein